MRSALLALVAAVTSVASVSSITNDGVFNRTSYSFIVVGAGPAGSVLANRLSENPNWNVLLLEAGDEPVARADVPLYAGNFEAPQMSWPYVYEAQNNMGFGLVNGNIDCPKGRTLGGGSSTNYMQHIRGHRRDFDNLVNSGIYGWSFDEILPYFKKSETSDIPNQDQSFHGLQGPFHVEHSDYRTDVVDAFVQSFQELGYAYTDYNGMNQTGVSISHVNTKNGHRSSAYTAYLVPVKNRSNLEIVTQALVSKITFSSPNQVDGVEVIKNNETYLLTAENEVIICGGALKTPQLMMLSGLGPADHLHELGIPLRRDLPVGKKLYDHVTYLGLYFTVEAPIVSNLTKVFGAEALSQYEFNSTGPLTMTGFTEALGFVKTNDSHPDSTYPDVQLTLLSTILPKNAFRIKPELWDEYIQPLQNEYAFLVMPMLYHPKSYGYMKLSSTNPNDAPKYYGNHLTDPEGHDVEAMIKAIRIMLEVVEQPAFQQYGAKFWDMPLPGCNQTFNSDEYWKCALSVLGSTLHHPTSTCKMGPANDTEAVVDSNLKVHGIYKLRIMDSSVIPEPQTTNGVGATIAMAEKASDMIKMDHGF